MPQGFQAWDASGNLVCDIGDRLSRVLGTLTLTASPTSLDIETEHGVEGDAWVAVPGGAAMAPDTGGASGTVTVSGPTISWTADLAGLVIVYGVR